MYSTMLTDAVLNAVYSGGMSQAPLQNPPAATAAPAIDLGDTLELLGLIAHIESNAFVQVATAAAQAVAPDQRLDLSRIAGKALARQELVLERMTQLGLSGEAADEKMFEFDETFNDYNARTEPSDLWEALLKEYVGHGVADDFCRIIASGLDPETLEVVTTALDGGVASDTAVDVLARASATDEVLSSRLALWGRRLVGEALSVVQVLLAQRPAIAHLVARAIEREAARGVDSDEAKRPTDSHAWLFSQLTASHTRRMGRLGLAA